MDLQAQIAARRAELAQLTKQAKDDDAKPIDDDTKDDA